MKFRVEGGLSRIEPPLTITGNQLKLALNEAVSTLSAQEVGTIVKFAITGSGHMPKHGGRAPTVNLTSGLVHV